MKFRDLDIGQRFELDNVAYVKTGPLLAGQVEGGGSKFMPRYVMVKLLDGAAPHAKVAQEKMLQAEEVLATFEAFHSACREELEKLAGALPASQLAELLDAIEKKRKSFLDALSKQ
jgi:hypothetical protein